MNIPFLFKVKENTYHKAFLINAFFAGIAAGLLLEYHKRDPFKLQINEITIYDKIFTITSTISMAIFFTYISYWVTRILFGYGNSVLIK